MSFYSAFLLCVTHAIERPCSKGFVSPTCLTDIMFVVIDIYLSVAEKCVREGSMILKMRRDDMVM